MPALHNKGLAKINLKLWFINDGTVPQNIREKKKDKVRVGLWIASEKTKVHKTYSLVFQGKLHGMDIVVHGWP